MKTGFLFINTIQIQYKISICYSGGIDSNYMLNKICKKKKAYKYLFIMYVFNDDDYNYQLFKILNIFYCYNISIFIGLGRENYLIKKHISQFEYRKTKISFIFETLKNLCIHRVIICHNYNDNIENIYMKFNNNCSFKEILMPYVKKIIYFGHSILVIRPLLYVSRFKIEKTTLPIVLDTDNNNSRYLRVFIRNNTNIILNSLYLDIYNKIFYFTNLYNKNLYCDITLDFNKKLFFFYKKNNLIENILLIKQASFLLVNNYNTKFNFFSIVNNILSNKTFCINSCLVRLKSDKIEVSRHRFSNIYIKYIYSNIHKYYINIYNFMNLEILSYYELKIQFKSYNEIQVKIDNIIFSISIIRLFFLNFIYIKNYYIIIILYISNYIKTKR